MPLSQPDEQWYKNAIIYGVDVGRFMDGDGDGIGDFRGFVQRLDYLADLGVTCLWVLPFFPTPGRDNGYDIKNYYGVDPKHGTLEDFLAFLHAAGERGLRVVLDLAINHTSEEHPWFQAARRDEHSRYRSYYTWSETPPPVPPDKGNPFPEQEPTVWTYDEVAGAHYFHRFYHFEPDLDLTNPAVLDEVKKVLDFWLSFDVSGFRIDAASYIVGDSSLKSGQLENPHAILKALRAAVAERRPHAALIGEADVPPEQLASYFGDGDEMNLLFNFALNNYIFLALAREQAAPIEQALRQLPAIPASCQWTNFLRNLDELDLQQLSEADRREIYDAFAPEETMQVFGRGARRRLAPMLEDNPRRLRLVFSLLFSLPGAPLLVYGDEIGMGEDLSQEGRNAVRAPMQWSAEPNAGFSDVEDASALVQPVVTSGPFSYEKVNVADQQQDEGSLLRWMKRLIYTRRQCKEIAYGNWHLLDSGTPSVLVHRCAWKNNSVVALHNLAGSEQQVTLNLRSQRGRRLTRLLDGPAQQPPQQPLNAEGALDLTLGPYGHRWYRVGGERG